MIDLVTSNTLLDMAVLEVVETNGFAARDKLDDLLEANGRNLSINPTTDDDDWVVRQTPGKCSVAHKKAVVDDAQTS